MAVLRRPPRLAGLAVAVGLGIAATAGVGVAVADSPDSGGDSSSSPSAASSGTADTGASDSGGTLASPSLAAEGARPGAADAAPDSDTRTDVPDDEPDSAFDVAARPGPLDPPPDVVAPPDVDSALAPAVPEMTDGTGTGGAAESSALYRSSPDAVRSTAEVVSSAASPASRSWESAIADPVAAADQTRPDVVADFLPTASPLLADPAAADIVTAGVGGPEAAVVNAADVAPEPAPAPSWPEQVARELFALAGLGPAAAIPGLPEPLAGLVELVYSAWRRFNSSLFNSAPSTSYLLSEQDPQTGVITGTLGADADGDALIYTVVEGPQNGTVDIAGDGTFTYTPDLEWATQTGGADAFVIAVSDDTSFHLHLLSGGHTARVAVPVSVEPLGAPPTPPGTGAPPVFEAANWLWDPISSSPVLAEFSRTWVEYLSAPGQGRVANLYEFGVGIVGESAITASTPRYDVTFTEPWGDDPFGSFEVPIPLGTKVAPGSDGHLVVLDPSTGMAFGLWQAKYDAVSDTWSASWGGMAALDGDGIDQSGGATASGLSRYAGVVTAAEFSAAVATNTGLDHALFFSTDIAGPGFVSPARSSDGSNQAGVAIPMPEGYRVQLDPSLDIDAIAGITPAEKVIAKTLQTYGAYAGDKGGARMAFAFELAPDATSDADPGAVWQDAGLLWDYYDMTHIPWQSLRVLQDWSGTV